MIHRWTQDNVFEASLALERLEDSLRSLGWEDIDLKTQGSEFHRGVAFGTAVVLAALGDLFDQVPEGRSTSGGRALRTMSAQPSER